MHIASRPATNLYAIFNLLSNMKMLRKSVWWIFIALFMRTFGAPNEDTNDTPDEDIGTGLIYTKIALFLQKVMELINGPTLEMESPNSTAVPPLNLLLTDEFKVFDHEKDREIFLATDDAVKYPRRIRIRRGMDYSEAGEIMPYDEAYDDETGGCTPKGLQTAEVRCIKWPSFIICFSYCIYGHTFTEGIMRENSCKFDNGRWSSPFEECKPFVDCTLAMSKPGNLKCIMNEVMKKPTCDVTCEAYENNQKMNQKIRCDSDGKWQPSKPFCVDKKGIDLVPAPRLKEHGKLIYPKKKSN